MASKCSIPVIDLQDFPNQSSKLIVALEEWGCFRLINHHHVLSPTLMSEMKAVVTSLYDLPVEIKRRNEVDVVKNSGYMTVSEHYDVFSLYDITSRHVLDDFCYQLELAPHKRETIIRYVESMQKLFLVLRDKMAESLGINGEKIEMEKWPFQLRLNKFNCAPETIGSIGVETHTDSPFLTILQDDEVVPGLEVLNKSGEFIPVDPWPNTLVVNVGDMATVWSNGRFHNVKHRVICKEAKKRVSIVTFNLGPREIVEPIPEFVDNDHPLMYAPTSIEDYRVFREATRLYTGQGLNILQTPSSN